MVYKPTNITGGAHPVGKPKTWGTSPWNLGISLENPRSRGSRPFQFHPGDVSHVHSIDLRQFMAHLKQGLKR